MPSTSKVSKSDFRVSLDPYPPTAPSLVSIVKLGVGCDAGVHFDFASPPLGFLERQETWPGVTLSDEKELLGNCEYIHSSRHGLAQEPTSVLGVAMLSP